MEFELLHSHWLVIGMVLVVAEIFLASFTILWFGLGALVVGITGIFLPMTLSVQILVWTVSSITFTVIWFKIIKPVMSSSHRGDDARQSAIGESGLVIKIPTDSTKGVMRFSTPLMDCDEWNFSCDVSVELGDRLHVEGISKDTLTVVKKIN
jgi:membrane protein implicated in regulation of membrane protease activity|tara:strand:+ start:266 stop:721 length:456 start_codon:yes stop_codon:yes gene_type:complete